MIVAVSSDLVWKVLIRGCANGYDISKNFSIASSAVIAQPIVAISSIELRWDRTLLPEESNHAYCSISAVQSADRIAKNCC